MILGPKIPPIPAYPGADRLVADGLLVGQQRQLELELAAEVRGVAGVAWPISTRFAPAWAN